MRNRFASAPLPVYVFIITHLSFALLAQSQNSLTVQETERALAKSIQLKDAKGFLEHTLQLATVYMADKNYEKASGYFTKSLDYSLELKDYSNQFVAYRNLGTIYASQKSFNKAVGAFEKCLKAAQAIPNKMLEAEAWQQIAMTEETGERFKKAIAPREHLLTLAVDLHDEKLQIECYSKLADDYTKLGKSESATIYKNLYGIMVTSRKTNELTSRKLEQVKQQVTRVEKEKGLTENKLAEQTEKLNRTKDSLREVELVNQQRQLQIDLLNKDKALAEANLREKDAQLENDRLFGKTLFIGGGVLGAVLAIVLIIAYRKKIETNNKIKKQSEQIKSSINYAKRIQEAMLPGERKAARHVQDSFVLFKPRDTVSGDFYWFSEIKNGSTGNDFAFAAVDCTGHGVPGAFMSMVGMKALHAITGSGVTKTDEILSSLHSEIRNALRQEETGNNDGMDVALCIYRKHKQVIEFSGAKNPLVYIQDNKLVQVKGDLHPIGGSKSKSSIVFKKHEIPISTPTTVYLFSDGFRDQFGGKDNTKFMSKKFTQLLFEIHQHPMEKQRELLDLALEEWKGDGHQTDDILVMGVKLGES